MNNLTNKSKKLVIGISILLIINLGVLAVVLLLQKDNSNTVPWIMIVITVLGIVSGGLVIINRIRRTRQTARLNKDFFTVYESIRNGINNSTLGVTEQNEVLLDMADMLLQAQESGRTTGEFTNNDISGFINRIIAAHGRRNPFIFVLLYGIQNFLFVSVITQCAIYFMRNSAGFFETTIAIMNIPFTLILCFILLPIIRQLISRQKFLWSFISTVAFVALYFVSNAILRTMKDDLNWVADYFNKEIPYITSWLILAVILLLFSSTFLIKAVLRRNSAWKLIRKS